jgi:hypothetical protein
MSTVLSYDDFLSEGLHIVKRKYTEKHPERVVSDYAPVREKVLSFLKEKGAATYEELEEFFKLMNEETGRKTGMGWIKANQELINVQESRGKKVYTLSKEGKRIHEKITSLK